jgi:ubiquinone/menaquinone biosynthesis C-methylase UbiE
MESEIKEKVAGHWDHWAGQYDNQYAHGLKSEREKEEWQKFLQETLGPPPQKVLDIGTGTGFIALLLAESGYHCKGLDISSGMLEEAKFKAKLQGLQVDFGLGDAEILPEADATYDVVVNRHLLWTLPNPERAIAEWIRVLKPGGRLVIIDGDWFYNKFHYRVQKFLGQLLVAITEWKNPWNHQNDYDEDLRAKLPLMRDANARNLIQLIIQSGLRDPKVKELTEVERAERRSMPLKQKLLNPYRRMLFIGTKY